MFKRNQTYPDGLRTLLWYHISHDPAKSCPGPKLPTDRSCVPPLTPHLVQFCAGTLPGSNCPAFVTQCHPPRPCHHLPTVALLPAHWGHLRSLRVNVSNPFAIIDGEIGPNNVFVVDSERSFNNHVVWENQAKEHWVATAPCSHPHSVDKRDPWENKG